MRNFRTEGIIIKRRNFSEADRLLTVMTRNYGKIQVKAAGVRKITSRRSAHIELLNYTILHLYKGNTFSILTEAKMIDDFYSIKKDFSKIGLAYHACELVDGLCPENQENDKVFSLLQRTLSDLSQDDVTYLPESTSSEIDDYTIGTFGIEVSEPLETRTAISDVSHSTKNQSSLLHRFEIALLSELGYLDRKDIEQKHVDLHEMIEDILERKLKSHSIFAKLQ